MGKRLYISMYHYVRDLRHSRYPSIKGLDISLFRQQLDFFSTNFNVITMEEVIDALNNKSDLPDNSLLLTFDDGYVDNYTYVFPLLQEYGFQGSFFVPGKTFVEHKLLDVNKIHYILSVANTGMLISDLMKKLDYYRGIENDYPSNEELFSRYAFQSRFDSKEVVFIKSILQTAIPERVRNAISSDLFKEYVGIPEEQLAYELYMNEDQIRMLNRNGMYLGIHGYDHYWLGDLPQEKMKDDLRKALEVMSDFIQCDEWVMNYPYGSFNEDVLDCVREMGAVLGLTTDVRVADIENDHHLLMPRLDCNDFPPKSGRYIDILRG